MHERFHFAAKITAGASYSSGLGTCFMGALGFLNDYGIAVGAVCAIVTMIANIIFKILDRRDKTSKR